MQVKSKNPTVKQLAIEKLKREHKYFIKQTVIKYKFKTYLKMFGIDLSKYIENFESDFDVKNYYKSKAKFYNNKTT